MRELFADAIKNRPIVLDGAMGTQLYERGVFINRSLEETVLRKPELVQRIHEEYVLQAPRSSKPIPSLPIDSSYRNRPRK